MVKKTQLFLGFIFLLFSVDMSSQKVLLKAEIQAESGEYLKSIHNYKSYLKDNPSDYSVVAKLSEVLALSGDLYQAETYYNAIPVDACEGVTFKKHGDLLKKLGRYDEAILKYGLYNNVNPNEGDHSIASTLFAKEAMSKNPDHEIIVMPSNSNTSDFGLTFYKGMPVFSSFREDVLMTESERDYNQDNTAHKTFLYNSKNNRLGYIKGLNGSINHIGPISFAENGNKCAIIEAKLMENYNLIRSFNSSSLHIADMNNQGQVISSKPFAFNEVGSSINSAQLAFDGSVIYFSSDRKGGHGGFDIYVSYNNNGVWSLPENLGPTINSSGDEITPYLYENTLYFASDYHYGLGGFDIFKSNVVNGIWTNPTNLGNGINSLSDDYFPVYNSKNELYVTSNRLGGRGSNDIYKTFTLNESTAKTEEYASIPSAVSLDQLAMETQKHTINTTENNTSAVSLKENVEHEFAFKLPEFDSKKVGTKSSENMSMEGAHRIGLDELIPNTEVFFIQLASISSSKPNFSKFKPLLRYGNIYKMVSKNTIKVRLGYFSEKKEAEDVLKSVRANGYKDAFIAYEILNTAVMELVLSGTDEQSFSDKGNFNTKNPDVAKEYKAGNKYKVRLASYEDPIWFDVNKVKDLGRIEQWTKGGWTIFILAGYNSLDEAKSAQIQATNRGYKTSEVVIDNGGVLERLKKN